MKKLIYWGEVFLVVIILYFQKTTEIKADVPLENPITISGKLYNLGTGLPIGVGQTVFTCYTVYGGTKDPTVAADGTFSFTVPRGRAFCVRGPQLSGYSIQATNRSPASANNLSYEMQIAGFDCAGVDASAAVCSSNASIKFEDRSTDSSYDLAYNQAPGTIDTLLYLLGKHPGTVLVGHPGSRNPPVGQPDPAMGYYTTFDMGARRAAWTWAYNVDLNRLGGNIYTWDDENIYLSEDASMHYFFDKGVWLKRYMKVGDTYTSVGNRIQFYDDLGSCKLLSVYPGNPSLNQLGGMPSGPDEFKISLESYVPQMSFDNLDGKMNPILNGKVIPGITGNMGNQEVVTTLYNESTYKDAGGVSHHSFERYYYSKEWGPMAAELVVDGVVTDRAVWNRIDAAVTGAAFPYSQLCNPFFKTTVSTPVTIFKLRQLLSAFTNIFDYNQLVANYGK